VKEGTSYFGLNGKERQSEADDRSHAKRNQDHAGVMETETMNTGKHSQAAATNPSIH